MRQSWNRVRSVVLAAGLACGLITAASAQSVILSLDNVNFSDGSTASGTISLNAYGQVEAADVNVTAGTLPAEAYFIPGPVAAYLPSPYDELTLYAGGYNIGLVLDVADPFSASMSGVDPITGGYQICSFSCPGVVSPGTSVNIVLADSPDLLVPEPASFVILASSLFGLGLVRARARAL